VSSTSQIGVLTVLSESSIGSGTRRVEALVSTDAFRHMAAERALVNEVGGLLRVPANQVTDRVGKLLADLKAAQKTIDDLQAARVLADAPRLLEGAKDVGGIGYVASSQSGLAPDQARQLALRLRDLMGSRAGVVAVVAGPADKPALIVATTAAARDAGQKAGALVRAGAVELGGQGGGRDDFAQGGGVNGAAAGAALAAIERAVGHAA